MMTKRNNFLSSSVIVLFLIIYISSFAAAKSLPYKSAELLITLSPEIKDAHSWLARRRLKLSQGFDKEVSGGASIQDKSFLQIEISPKETVQQAMARLKGMAGVVHVQPNYRYRLYETLPDDPSFSVQWGLKNTGQNGGQAGADISAPLAWDVTTGSSDVVVAVIDTGAYYSHLDLSSNIWFNPGETINGADDDGNGYIDDWYGWDFLDDDNDPLDDHSHGTHVAGIIGALGNNNQGVSGVCWDVSLMILDAFNSSGVSFSADLIEAVEYAHNMGARIINASWGDQYNDLLLEDAIRAFVDGGGLFVCAAGNDDINNDYFTSYPANYDIEALISVGSSTRHETVSGFSSTGKNRVHLFAPGSSIYSTIRYDSYGYKSGTSMSSPFVSGAAALLWSWNPGLSNLEVKYRLMSGGDADPAYFGKSVSGKRLNAANIFFTDTVPPSGVNDLRWMSRDYDQVLLKYTAPGDDGNSGLASYYDLRYSKFPITEANWDFAHRAYDEPLPAPAGSPLTVVVDRLTEGTDYYFRLRSIDEAGNRSPLSNELHVQTRNVRVLFSDDMESGTGQWEVPSGSDWAQTTYIAQSGSVSWTDSPLTYYRTGQSELISPEISLASAGNPMLRFWHRFDLENEYASARVHVSTDNGQTWSGALVEYTNSADWWLQETVDLSAYKGEPSVQFRFVVDAERDDSFFDGWYIDDVRVVDTSETTGISGWWYYQ